MNAGGIWQDVKLVSVPRRWIEHVRVTTDIHAGTVTVEVELAGTARQQTNNEPHARISEQTRCADATYRRRAGG